MDAEESACVGLEEVSEKDIRRECVGLYAALGIDVPAPCEARSKAGSFPHLKAGEEYPAIAQRARAENAVIYWGDETGIDNCSNCERGFAPKGQPSVLQVDTKRERLNMLSALSRQGDVHLILYEDSLSQQRLTQFMNRLVRTSKRKVFLILDNLKVHHGKKAAAWLDRH